MNPDMATVHHEEADGPTECITVMAQDFKSLMWETLANVPSYGEWLLAVDQHSAYEHHKLVLQILQSQGVRGRWTLKSPHHSTALDALSDVYPGRHLRAVASGSGGGGCLQLQPDSDVEQALHRRRSARIHRAALGG